MIRLVLAALALACFSLPVNARPVLHPSCNTFVMPCQVSSTLSMSSKSLTSRRQEAKPAASRQAYLAARGARFERQMPFGRAIVRPSSESHFESYGLVERARAYLGGNPTGWRRVWCGRFMAMIAPDAAAKIRNPNMARDWAGLPHVQGRVGAIAVLSRGRKGGHVGVVSGFDERGNPRIVSGNHGRRVGEAVYPAGRVLAYVSL